MFFKCRMIAAVIVGLFAVSALAQNQLPREGQPQEKRADLMGQIRAVAPDGHSLTIAMTPRPGPDGQPPARDARTEQAVVILTDKTKLLFFGVSEGQAQPAPGQMAMVWLEEGSKDQAARVRFMKREGEERPDVQGRIIAIADGGKTITVETKDRDQVTGKVDLHIAPYTQSLYYGVDQDGAKPTTDYLVIAWLEKDQKMCRRGFGLRRMKGNSAVGQGVQNPAAKGLRVSYAYADSSGRPATPQDLLRRLRKLAPPQVALGGVIAARHWHPQFDLNGTPRLDLVYHVPHGQVVDLGFIGKLDPALTMIEGRTTAPSLVVRLLVRSESQFNKGKDSELPWADPVEAALDLNDLQLENQANQMFEHLRNEARPS